MDEFNPAAVQYDGFEKLQLIAGQDFSHSSKTFSSGLWRGNPTPVRFPCPTACLTARVPCAREREFPSVPMCLLTDRPLPAAHATVGLVSLRRLVPEMGHRDSAGDRSCACSDEQQYSGGVQLHGAGARAVASRHGSLCVRAMYIPSPVSGS